MASRDENIIDYIFRAKDAKRVEDAVKSIGEAFDKLDAGADGADDALEDAQRKFDALGQSTQQAQGHLRGFLGDLPGIAKIGAGFAAAQLAVSAFSGALQKLREAWDFTINKAAEQEQAVIRLETAMRTSGTFSRQASRDFQDFASAMQQVTAVGDESTIALGALINQIGGLQGRVLERATEAALDLQVALGKTEREVGILFGKLAQGETGTLTEIGIVIDQTLPRAEKFNAALEAIERAFGGTARSQVDSYAGATQQLANAWGDLGEAIGEFALPALTKFAQAATGIVTQLSNTVRGIRGETTASVTEMAQIFDQQLALMSASVGKTRRDIEQGLSVLREATVAELRLTVRTAEFDEVVRTLEELDDIIANAARAGNREFQALIQDMRDAVEEEFTIRVNVEAQKATTALANLARGLEPDPELNVLIKGTEAFQDAVRLAQGARDEIERPALFGGTEAQFIDLDELARQVQNAENKLAELHETRFLDPTVQSVVNIEIEEAEKRLLELRSEYESFRALWEQGIESGQIKLNVQTGRESISEQRDVLQEQLQQTLDREQIQVVASARVKIQSATSTDELQQFLADLEKQAIQAAGRAEAQPTPENKALRDALIQANLQAKALAEIRAQTLRLAEDAKELGGPLERVVNLLTGLQRLGGGTSAEIFDTATFVRNVGDASEAASRLDEAVKVLAERGEPRELAQAYAALDAAIRAANDGVEGLDDDLVEAMRRNRDEVRALVEELEPLERARIIAIEAKVDLAADDFVAVEAKISLLRELVEQFPDIEIGVVLTQLENDLEKAKNSAAKAGKDVKESFEKETRKLTLEAVGSATTATLQGMVGDAAEAFNTIDSLFRGLIQSMLDQLAGLAVSGFLSLLASVTSGGAPFIPLGLGVVTSLKTGLDDAQGGLPPFTRPPTDITESSVRQFVGEVARPLNFAIEQLQLQNSLALIRQRQTPPQRSARDLVSPFLQPGTDVRTVVNAQIRALDSADFERYMRDGPGARAMANLAAAGRLG